MLHDAGVNRGKNIGSILLCCSAWLGYFGSSMAASAALFPVTEVSLTNGLRILTLEDHSSPLVAVQVWYRVGSADEPAGRQGFAHLFEHMMFRGTDRLGPTDHFDLLHSVGGGCNAFTSFDETCYHEDLPASQLALALWLESERMAFLTVDGAGFSTERKVVEEERRLDLDMPYGELADKGPPLVFGKDPYGHDPLGTFQDLRQATPTDVHAWWTRWYTPNNATLVVVGDVKLQQVRALCEKYFGWIPPVPQPARNLPALGAFDATREVTLNLANAPAPAVAVVWRTVPEGHPDALALDVLAIIVGGDPSAFLSGAANSSRLYRRLVAEEHLAVMATAMQFGLARAGLFGAGAALSPLGGNPARTMTVLRQELERLREEGVTDEELEKARNQVLKQTLVEAQTVEGKASLIGRAAVVGGGIAELNSRLDRLRALNREELQRVARLYLAPQHIMSVTVPGSSLWGQLSRFFRGSRKAEETASVVSPSDTVLRGREGVTRPNALPLRPPISDGNPAVPTPPFSEHRLTNGLRVLVVPNPAAPLVHAVFALPFGAWAEDKPGTAATALDLLAKGSESHDEKALAESLDRYGIGLSATATHDDSRVSLTCLQEHADRAFALLAEVITRPTFPEGPLKTAVNQSLTELQMADSAPAMVVAREFERHLYAGHPYGRRLSGEAGDLAALRREDLVRFWRRIAEPQDATLVVAGGLSDQRALALAERAFGSWQGHADDRTKPAFPPAPPQPARTRLLLVDWPGANQSQILISGFGITNCDPAKPIANLVSSYFGGSFGSRLMNTIRVQKGATYGAGGGFEAGRFAGSFMVRTFTKTASTAEVVRTALAEIRGLAERPPTTEELALHKRYFSGSAAARCETPEQIAGQLTHNVLNGLPLDYLQRSLAAIADAKAEDCTALVNRVVAPEHLLIVVVGDASVLGKELKSIAPVTVIDREGKVTTPE